MTDYGILGVSFIILFILGFVSKILLTVGILLVIVSLYDSRIRHRELMSVLVLGLLGVEEEDG
jgi:hypothetical protein